MYYRDYVRKAIRERMREKSRNGDLKEIRKRAHKRRQENPNAKIANLMGCRINRVLKKRGASWLCFVPYSVEDLIFHLEKQFTPEMNWGNHGSYWHIDHIRPISSFNMTSFDCDDFKKCWALENLRPLEAIENIKKGNKMDYYNSLNNKT